MQTQNACWNVSGRDPLSQNLRKFRYRIKWNEIFRKLSFENSGQPLEVVLFFRKLGNTGNFLFHLAFHHQIDVPDSPCRFLVSYPPQNANICFLGAMNGRPCGFPTGMRPVWITPWQRSSDVSLLIRK